jgi:MFS family permease
MDAEDTESKQEPSTYLLPTIGIGVLQFGALTASRLAVPLFAIQQGAASWVVGLMAALFAVGPALTSVHIGRWMDRSGLIFPVVLAGSIGTLAAAFAAFWPSVPSMFLVAPLIGSSAIVAYMAVARAMGAVDEIVTRSRNFGYLTTGYALVQFLGPLMAGAVFDIAGVRAVFLAILVFPALSLAILAGGRHGLTVVRGTPAAKPVSLHAIDLLRIPRLRRALLSNGIFAASMALIPFVAALQSTSVGLSATAASGVVASASLGAIAMRVAIALFPSWFVSHIVLGCALAAAAIGYALLSFFHAWIWLAGLNFLLGMAVGIGQPLSLSLIYAGSPRERINESLGVAMTLGNVTQSLAPLALGLVASAAGVAPMLWLMGTMLAVAAIYIVGPK